MASKAILGHQLRKSVEEGDRAAVTKVLAQATIEDINAKDREKCTALQLALESGKSGYLDIVQDLLDAGATVGSATLREAAKRGDKKIMAILLTHCTIEKINGFSMRGGCYRALHLAAENGHAEIMKMLLDGGAECDARTDYGNTALMKAAEHGFPQCILEALAHGAKLQAKNIFRETALEVAKANNQAECVSLLEATASPDSEGQTSAPMNRAITPPSPPPLTPKSGALAEFWSQQRELAEMGVAADEEIQYIPPLCHIAPLDPDEVLPARDEFDCKAWALDMLGRGTVEAARAAFCQSIAKQWLAIATGLLEQPGAGAVITPQLLEQIQDDTDFVWHKVVADPSWARVVGAVTRVFRSEVIRVKDDQGRRAYEIACKECHEAMDEAVLFVGRFRLKEKVHQSPTCAVYLAEDIQHDDDAVAVKLMLNRDQYEREVCERERLDDSCVVGIAAKSDDDELRVKWAASCTFLLEEPENAYKHGIVMPAAQRNLAVILMEEYVGLAMTKSIVQALLQALEHMHEHGWFIHGDLKPLNIVRMPGGAIRLIDLDGVVRIGDPVGAKDLSTAFVGPETTLIRQGAVEFRARGVVEEAELLTAHPTFDLWSLGVILFQALAHQALLESDTRDKLVGVDECQKLASWGPMLLSTALARADRAMKADGVPPRDRLVACDLLGWLLQADPDARPQTCAEALAHPFLTHALPVAPQRSSTTLVPSALSARSAVVVAVDAAENGEGGGSRNADAVASAFMSQVLENVLTQMTPVEEAAAEEEATPGQHQGKPNNGLRIPRLHFAAALGDVSAVQSLLSYAPAELNACEPLLGRTALSLAATHGHVDVVRVLVDQLGLDADVKDDTGRPPAVVVMDLLNVSGESGADRALLASLAAICKRADLGREDAHGRSGFSIGLASPNRDVRQLVAHQQREQFVLSKLRHKPLPLPFAAEDFVVAWNDKEKRPEIEQQLWNTTKTLFSRPITTYKKNYLEQYVFALPGVWDSTSFERLKTTAVDTSQAILNETFRLRDEEILAKPQGAKLADIESFPAAWRGHPLPANLIEELRGLAKTPHCAEQVDEVVLVSLVQALAEQAIGKFKKKLECLGIDAGVATWAPDAEPPAEALPLPSKLVFLAPVKGAARMGAKVAEYKREAEKQAGADVSAAWPHIQKLGDSLRCTIECLTAADMLESWLRVREEFEVSKDRGRLKNKLHNTRAPPDMLVNVVFDAGGYELVGEIQIHLRSIHRLKQELHFPYEVARARGISELCGAGHMRPPAPKVSEAHKFEMPEHGEDHDTRALSAELKRVNRELVWARQAMARAKAVVEEKERVAAEVKAHEARAASMESEMAQSVKNFETKLASVESMWAERLEMERGKCCTPWL